MSDEIKSLYKCIFDESCSMTSSKCGELFIIKLFSSPPRIYKFKTKFQKELENVFGMLDWK